jgi:hypothetical protein
MTEAYRKSIIDIHLNQFRPILEYNIDLIYYIYYCVFDKFGFGTEKEIQYSLNFMTKILTKAKTIDMFDYLNIIFRFGTVSLDNYELCYEITKLIRKSRSDTYGHIMLKLRDCRQHKCTIYELYEFTKSLLREKRDRDFDSDDEEPRKYVRTE